MAAFSPMRRSPKIFDPETRQQADLTLADYERLTQRCQAAIAEGQKLRGDLMLPIMAGGGLAGYHAIARNLYAVATDPTLSRELHPRPATRDNETRLGFSGGPSTGH